MPLSIDALLDFEPEGWKPEAGDKVRGEVVRIQTWEDTKFGGGDYLVIDILTDPKNLQGYRIYGNDSVLRREFDRRAPREGDEIGIKFLGKTEGKASTYNGYQVICRSGQPPAAPAPAAPTDDDGDGYGPYGPLSGDDDE